MDETPESSPKPSPTHQTTPARRSRVGRKRTVFRSPPKPAWPVRGLWEAAPAEEKERAHEICMEILEYWLGKKSKGEVAQDLDVSRLRVWQLSQQALSGMMAGLLTQPRRRVGPEVFEGRPDETRSALKACIAELEKKLERTEDLVRVLRTAPWVRASSDSTPKGGPSRARKTQRKRAARRDPRAETKGVQRDAPESRSAPAIAAPLEEDSGGAG
jgi:hypothetical protein